MGTPAGQAERGRPTPRGAGHLASLLKRWACWKPPVQPATWCSSGRVPPVRVGMAGGIWGRGPPKRIGGRSRSGVGPSGDARVRESWPRTRRGHRRPSDAGVPSRGEWSVRRGAHPSGHRISPSGCLACAAQWKTPVQFEHRNRPVAHVGLCLEIVRIRWREAPMKSGCTAPGMSSFLIPTSEATGADRAQAPESREACSQFARI